MVRYSCGVMLVIWLLSFWTHVQAQTLAFPSAEGFGRFASGGRGGSVCKVTNLNDSGAGSLRYCLGQSGPRTIVFTVSGIITLSSPVTVIPDNVTIACQSAPGQGVLIKGSLKFWNTDNVIMRFCRLRPAPPTTGYTVGISVTGPYAATQYSIFDHLSLGWISDDMFGLTSGSDPAQAVNITVQWSIFSETVKDPAGYSPGAQGATGGGVYNATGVLNVSWLYNLYSNVNKRVPHPGSGTRHQVVNQVLHNVRSGMENIYFLARYQPTIANVIGNWYRNPGTNWGYTVLGCGWPNYTCNAAAEHASNIYFSGNVDTVRRPDAHIGSELSMVLLQNANNFTVQSTTPNAGFPTLPSQTTAANAYTMVLAKVGAHRPYRDAIDQRAISDAANNVRRASCSATPGTICFNYPTYASGTVPADSDNDGIPNAWELSHGLNPNDPSDGRRIAANGYTNLENFLNELAGDNVGIGSNMVISSPGSPGE